MITEAQRRALFALREALHLCEGADISIAWNRSDEIVICGPDAQFVEPCGTWVEAFDVECLLSRYPEPV